MDRWVAAPAVPLVFLLFFLILFLLPFSSFLSNSSQGSSTRPFPPSPSLPSVPFPFDIVIYSLRRLNTLYDDTRAQFWRIYVNSRQIRISILVWSKRKRFANCFVTKTRWQKFFLLALRISFFFFFPSISRFLIRVPVKASRNSDTRNSTSLAWKWSFRCNHSAIIFTEYFISCFGSWF